MKPASQAFEIGYGPKWELLDHSKVYLGGVPGTASFLRILPKLKAALPVETFEEVEQDVARMPRIEQWVQLKSSREVMRINGVDLVVTWEKPAERVGLFSIRADGNIASITLLLCREDEQCEDKTSGLGMIELMAFMSAISPIIGEENAYDHRRFHLVDMTRRPQMVSMFWPPYSPTNDTRARTIQLQVANAFFRMNGELA